MVSNFETRHATLHTQQQQQMFVISNG